MPDVAIVPARPVEGCNWCHSRIVWGVTSGGKRMPLDPEPTVNGNVYFTYDPEARLWRATVQTRHEKRSEAWAEVPLHVHHGTTCPHAREWWKHAPTDSGKEEPKVTKPDAVGTPSGLEPALHPTVQVRPIQEGMF